MNADEIIRVIVDRGSWTARRDALEVDPAELRRQLRAAAKAHGIRVLTSTAGGLFTAYWPEHEKTDIQQRALHAVIRSIDDPDPVSYDEALATERRRQIRPL